MKTCIFVVLLVLNACARSGPDKADRPTKWDEVKSGITGRSVFDELSPLNQTFDGNLSSKAGTSNSTTVLRLYSVPAAEKASRKGNVFLRVAGEIEIDGKLMAVQGELTHYNVLNSDSRRLKVRQFIDLDIRNVRAACEGCGEDGEIAKNHSDFLATLAANERQVSGVKFLAEHVSGKFVEGIVRGKSCVKDSDTCSDEVLGTWSTSSASDAWREVVNDSTILTPSLRIEEKFDENGSGRVNISRR